MSFRLNVCRLMFTAGAAMIGLSDGHAQTLLKREPPMGALREGQSVLVDDGKCPKGQLRLVTGGNHVEVGGTKRVRRSSQCVNR